MRQYEDCVHDPGRDSGEKNEYAKWRGTQNAGIRQGHSRMISANGEGKSLLRVGGRTSFFPTLSYGLSGNMTTPTTT